MTSMREIIAWTQRFEHLIFLISHAKKEENNRKNNN